MGVEFDNIPILDQSIPWYDRLTLIKENQFTEYFDQAILESPEPEVRLALLYKLTNHKILKYLLKVDPDPKVRLEVLRLLLPSNQTEILRGCQG